MERNAMRMRVAGGLNHWFSGEVEGVTTETSDGSWAQTLTAAVVMAASGCDATDFCFRVEGMGMDERARNNKCQQTFPAIVRPVETGKVTE